MYTYKARQKPFRPANSFKSLSKRPTTPPPNTSSIDEEDSVINSEPIGDLYDQETGERISFTKAKWTAKEGRLSLNAKIILDMGTGRLDIKSNSNSQATVKSKPQSLIAINYRSRELVAEFLAKGPRTPYMHVDWDPRTNRVRTGEASDVSDDVTSSYDYTATASLLSSPSGGNETSSYPGTAQDSSADHALAVIHQDQWARFENKIFTELFDGLEMMERNKSLTKEEKFPGGLPALRAVALTLAKVKVKQRRELAQALEDEQERESKREQAEREAWDQPDHLKDIKKTNQKQRLQGKTYLEHLQRDHEVIYIRKLKELGFLW